MEDLSKKDNDEHEDEEFGKEIRQEGSQGWRAEVQTKQAP